MYTTLFICFVLLAVIVALARFDGDYKKEHGHYCFYSWQQYIFGCVAIASMTVGGFIFMYKIIQEINK